MIFKNIFSFKIVLFKNIFSSKLCFLKIFFPSKSCFLKIFFLQNHAFWKLILFLNLTRRKIFNSKLWFLNLLFRLLLHCYQRATENNFVAWCKRFFYECAACVCAAIGAIFLVIAFFMALRVLVGCVDYIICTTSWFIQISLEFRKWLIYKDLILKDIRRFIDGRINWKPHCVGRRAWQGEFSFYAINTGVCQTHGTSQATEKLSIWSKNRKCSWLYL